MNNRFEGRGNRQNGSQDPRLQNDARQMNGKQRDGHQTHRPEGGDSNYGLAHESPSFNSQHSDAREHQFDARDLGYGGRDGQFAGRGSMQSNNQYGNEAMRSGQHASNGNQRYDSANRGAYNGALDDSLWGPSHYPHPTSSGTTWAGGSYGGGSSFGIGIGDSAGSMGVPFRSPSVENQFGGHDYGRGHEAHAQQPQFPRGPKGYKRSDDRLKEDLCERLHHAYDVDSSDVEVEVKNGELTLSGTVPTREMRYRLEHLADGVVGLSDINNIVKVKRETSSPTPNANPKR